MVITSNKRETEVILHDISEDGVGFDLPPGKPRNIIVSVGSQVRFKCLWNPHLFGNDQYKVLSIVGHRVGAKRL